jgi:hypothetical protein
MEVPMKRDNVFRSRKVAAILIVMLLFIGWLVFMDPILNHFSDSPYHRGIRAYEAGNTREASRLFAESVRDNTKGWSARAEMKLLEMTELSALTELIGLWDLSSGAVGEDSRKLFCKRIRKAFELVAPNLPCTPGASQESRKKEKKIMLQELEKAKASCDWVDGQFVPRPTVSTQAGQ